MGSIFHLVYISHAADDLSYSDIRNILNVSRFHNAEAGITGVLILREGYFLQVLEGDEAQVKSLVSRIERDDRNHSLKIVIEDQSEKRLFSEWSMAFLDGDIEVNSTKELIEFFEVCLQSGIQKRVMIMPLVRRFRASAPAFQ
ncbi:MAG: BLUF domain-containing protein [Bacillota bacterium]